MRRFLLALVFCMSAPFAHADGFDVVQDEEQFVKLIAGKALTRLGIRLNVDPQGRITGRAFGREVTGQWDWNGGYFCRDLNYGEDPLEFNCQMVKVRGNTVRFISDRGEGIYADLRLR